MDETHDSATKYAGREYEAVIQASLGAKVLRRH